jgi:CRISPR-associated endonuclease Cas1
MAQQLPVHFASAFGRYQGSVWSGEAASRGASLWPLQQQCFSDPALAIQPARAVVMARIRHQREVLRQRRPAGLARTLGQLDEAIRQAGKAQQAASLNGIEGHAASLYFGAIGELVPAEFGFEGRNRRPPRDPFNALLSLGYSLLHAHADSFCRAQGLYPWTGFYHQPRSGHAALASDLIEPFRHLVERTALAALTRGSFSPEEFRQDPRQGCRLEDTALRRYLAMLWERLDKPVQAAGEEEPLSPRHQLHAQNQRLIDWLRGGTEFRPWLTR